MSLFVGVLTAEQFVLCQAVCVCACVHLCASVCVCVAGVGGGGMSVGREYLNFNKIVPLAVFIFFISYSVLIVLS